MADINELKLYIKNFNLKIRNFCLLINFSLLILMFVNKPTLLVNKSKPTEHRNLMLNLNKPASSSDQIISISEVKKAALDGRFTHHSQ